MAKETLRGKLITTEGPDSSGKGTQVKHLKARIEATGIAVAVYDFPRYDSFFGGEVARLMRGEYGPLDRVDPFLAALLYADDRQEVAPSMKLDLESGCCVVCNRYVSSNLAHGGAKYKSLEEAIAFIGKVEYLEYTVHGLPRPNLEFFLDVPSEKARMLASVRGEREYLGGKGLDLAEADLGHQEKAGMMYRWLCENRSNFVRIECTTTGWDMLLPEKISNLIWEQIVARGWAA